jgi:hypothetical protein
MNNIGFNPYLILFDLYLTSLNKKFTCDFHKHKVFIDISIPAVSYTFENVGEELLMDFFVLFGWRREPMLRFSQISW